METLLPCKETCSWNLCLGTLAWEPFPENLLGTLIGNVFLGTLLRTSSWESCLGTVLGNLFLGTLLGNLLLGTLAWEPVPGNLACEPLGNLLGPYLTWESVPGNLAWEPVPGNLAWEDVPGNGNPCLGTSRTLLGNMFLGTLPGNLLGTLLGNLAWKPCLETSSWEPCLGEPLGNLAWEPVPGNRAWEPVSGNLGTLAWDSLGKGDPFLEAGFQRCAVRIWLLRRAPGPLLWLKTPSLLCWGKKQAGNGTYKFLWENRKHHLHMW